jgi:hypothetical protein
MNKRQEPGDHFQTISETLTGFVIKPRRAKRSATTCCLPKFHNFRIVETSAAGPIDTIGHGLPVPELSLDCRVRCDPGRGLRERIPFKEFDRIADSQNGFRGIVGNLEAELPFEFERQLDHVEAIGPEIIDEARAIDHLIGIDK